ncbi:hypothetical protein LINJ_02_0720 [Leishmania infantum JPCM5]|uniref:Uncharacterized protein n=2 Tax=Leishmania infantum TaxID=5671 RepID=A4HRS0_LEIIN|nr:hypothetical protein LINJ_02_0720 [Leishmania infantum JPCM5]CAC9501014.1 hypothetical_protein_-_conserved [Leishmania infantum]CAM65303.1 hypothetical protein LINJ_02_0720 [Leishmania infantum JPCM5]SUZ43162.1 hypothetical_protein_-_conserved [Leishmania infantum]|eukprot:XP_001462762.1 hypothetical protein LINJ_02_0720 [Leishmania infantum JPCM5]
MPLLTSCAVVSLLLVCVLWRMEDGVELCAVGLVSCFGCRALRMAMRFSLFSLHAFLVLVRAHCPLAYTLLFVAGGLVLHACALLYLSLSLGMRALRSSCPAFPCWQASPSTTPLLREISRNEPPSAKNERNNPDYSSMKPSKRAANLDSRGATSADHSTAASHTEAVPPLTVDTLTVPLVHAECSPTTAPLSPGNGLTPTLAECASEAARRPTEAAPVSAVEALPPTPTECASDAAPQKIKMTARKRHATASLHRKRERDGASDSSLWPLHTRRALDPSANTAAPLLSEAAPVSAVYASCCRCRRSVWDLACDRSGARRRRCVLRRVKTSQRSKRRVVGPSAPAAASRSRLKGGWHALVRMLRRWYRSALCVGHRLICRRSRTSARDAAPQVSEVSTLRGQNALPADVPQAPRVVSDAGTTSLPVCAHCIADS